MNATGTSARSQAGRIWSVLRVHPEPSVCVRDAEVHAALTADPAGYVSWVDRRLEEIALDRATVDLPPKAILADGEGDFRVMPCVVRRRGGVCKTVKVVGTDLVGVEVPDQITVGRALRLHPRENYVTHVFDACVLSSARTGAMAAIAAKRLAKARARVCIIGAGRVGFYSACYVAALGDVSRIDLIDADAGRADRAAAALREMGPACGVGTSSAALSEADVVVVATTAREPVLDPGDTGAGLIVSLGADAPDQRELSEAWAEGAEVFTDTGDSFRVGDLRAWVRAGRIDPGDVRPILDAFRGGCPIDRPRVLVSTGSALMDNLTIDYLLSGAR